MQPPQGMTGEKRRHAGAQNAQSQQLGDRQLLRQRAEHLERQISDLQTDEEDDDVTHSWQFVVRSSRFVAGIYLGGAIAPGLGLSADALFNRAARLSRVDIKRPAKVIGTNTVGHLQSGLYFGYIGLVDGIIERIIAELGVARCTPASRRASSPAEAWRA